MNALTIFLVSMAVAIATVIFIHLFFKRVSKTVPFTYTWLLKRTLQQIRRRRRLQHILILLLRTGIIALVTLALLSFFFNPERSDIPSVVIIDNSASMTRDDPPLLWQAIKWIEDNVDNFLYAITCNNIIKDKGQLTNIEPYYGFCSLDKQLALLHNLSDTVRIYVISDFQRGYNTGLVQRPFVPVLMEGTAENTWVDSLWLAKDNIVVKWINTGSKDVSLQLKVNDKVKAVKKWRSIDSLQYDTIPIKPEGRTNTIHISISGDPVYFDNDFYAVLGTQPTRVYMHISDTTVFHLAPIIAKDTLFDIVSDPSKADVIIAGFMDDLPESMRSSLLNLQKPKILLYSASGSDNRVWLNRRNSFLKGVIQDYGKAPTPLSIYAPCPQTLLPGTQLLFTDSCTIASIENKTLHAIYDPNNATLSSHPIYIAIIYKVLLGNKAYTLNFFRNNEKTISLFTQQQINLVPLRNESSRTDNLLFPKPGFYYMVSAKDTQLIGINLPKEESNLKPNVPKITITQGKAETIISSLAPYLLISFALILLLIESLVLRKRKDYEENAS